MQEAGRWLWDVRTPMRDGVELSTDLHLPPGGLSGGPYPLVAVRTAANNQAPMYVKRARLLADEGIAVALQDVRGREDSDGTFSPFRDEGRDGYDTVEWLAAQDWCNGKVAMMGSGYAGWTQWAAARERPPHLTTLVSTSAWAPGTASGAPPLPMLAWLHAMSARVWQEAGQVDWEQVLRTLPLRDADKAIACRLPEWPAFLDAQPLADVGPLALPVLHIAGWQDLSQAFRFWNGMRDAADQNLVVGPWDAAGTWSSTQQLGGIDFGLPAAMDLDALHVQWFRHWLTDGDRPPSRHFVTGTNTWYDVTWQPSADSTTLFLRSGGVLTEAAPAEEPADSYVYDPDEPVLVSTDFTFFPSAPKQPPQLPLDRRFVERRRDVLVYTSDRGPDALRVSGTPSVLLFVSSDRTDTDVFVELTDVSPGGASQLLATGALRARYRDGLDTESPLVPGEVHELSIELGAVAHVVQAGHRLRLNVMSSCFPLFDRNLNTGGRVGHESEPLVAINSVHHDAEHPSQLVLPLVRGEQ